AKQAHKTSAESSPSPHSAHRAGIPASDEPEPAREHATPEERLAEVQTILDEGADPTRLAGEMAALASEPEAIAARRSALAALRKVQPPSVKLSSLVNAMSGSSALANDPLHAEMVNATVEALGPEDLQSARDMMISASNPGTRQLLASSLAAYA